MLRTLILTFNNSTRRQVSYSYSRFGFVYMLTACARRTVGINLQIGRVDIDFNIFRLGEYRNGNRRSMNTPPDFRFRELFALGDRPIQI